MKGYLTYTDDPIVSSDIVTDPSSCVFDSGLTKVTGDLVKIGSRVEDLRPCRHDPHRAQSQPMEHLTTLDASFLQAEDSDPHVSLAVGGVSIVDPPIALKLRTGIAMLSYAGRFCFGITADYDSAPDVDALARGIEDGVERLAAIGRSRRGKSSQSIGLESYVGHK